MSFLTDLSYFVNMFVDERETAPPISSYLLTQEQLLENEYPVPTWMLDSPQVEDDWLQIPEFTGNPNDECRVLALDCEMVSTIPIRIIACLHRLS